MVVRLVLVLVCDDAHHDQHNHTNSTNLMRRRSILGFPITPLIDLLVLDSASAGFGGKADANAQCRAHSRSTRCMLHADAMLALARDAGCSAYCIRFPSPPPPTMNRLTNEVERWNE